MWVDVTEEDLAATLSQREIDAFRSDGPLDGSDPIEKLLARTVATVRGYISCNGGVRMEPFGKKIPEGLVIAAMDFTAAKLLKRLNIPLNEDRREAFQKAVELFENIAIGKITPESWTSDGTTDNSARRASTPLCAQPASERLLD